MNRDVALAEQASTTIALLKTLALGYPDGHPDQTTLKTAATITSTRVVELLGEPVDEPATLRLVGGEGGT